MNVTVGDLLWGGACGAGVIVLWRWLERHNALKDRGEALPLVMAIVVTVILYVALRLLLT